MIPAKDFVEMLSLFEGSGVEYMVIGGYAVAAYGFPRYTGDLDLFVRSSKDNEMRVKAALRQFGIPISFLSQIDFSENYDVFQIGYPPNRVDIITSASGIRFDEANPVRRRLGAHESIEVNVIGLEALIRNKVATGRAQDLADVENLQKIRKNLPNGGGDESR